MTKEKATAKAKYPMADFIMKEVEDVKADLDQLKADLKAVNDEVVASIIPYNIIKIIEVQQKIIQHNIASLITALREIGDKDCAKILREKVMEMAGELKAPAILEKEWMK